MVWFVHCEIGNIIARSSRVSAVKDQRVPNAKMLYPYLLSLQAETLVDDCRGSFFNANAPGAAAPDVDSS